MARHGILLTDDVTVYTDKILHLADMYINSLEYPEDISKPNNLFNGLIKFIHVNYFKQYRFDYSDIEFFNNVWDIYTSLCYKHNKSPTIIEYCLLLGISRETLHSWKTSTTRNYKYFDKDNNPIKDIAGWKINHQGEEYRQEISTSHSDTVKKWLEECENNLLRGATEQNKVGCIFVLKANYGYTETAPIPAVNPHQTLTASELPRLGQSEPLQISGDSE